MVTCEKSMSICRLLWVFCFYDSGKLNVSKERNCGVSVIMTCEKSKSLWR